MSRPFRFGFSFRTLSEEARRTEVLLAGIRAAIACCLLAAVVETVPRPSRQALGFFSLFLAYSCVVLILVRYLRSSMNLLVWTSQAADLLWALSISMGFGTLISPLPVWLLVILTAAWRWELGGALAAAGACSLLSLLSDLLLSAGRLHGITDLERTATFLAVSLPLGYLLGQRRERQAEDEWSLLARELHDGPVQALTALEIRIELLRRQVAGDGRLQRELAEMQQLLREQILEVRDFMHRLKAGRIGPCELPGYLASYADKFSLETGIIVDFASECGVIDWSSSICQEVVRIVQEALVNVRKHSGAKHVRVRLAREGEQWKLLVIDDGRGFGFEGRMTQAELEATRRLPVVLSERVRAIRGNMTVESTPGGGARLEIAIPAKA